MPNRIDRPTTPPVTTGRTDNPVLREGANGTAVARLQTALNQAGFNAGTADGSFGRGTTAAVKAFQSANGLTADGIVGPKVWDKLASSPAGPSTPSTPTRPAGWGTNTGGNTTTPWNAGTGGTRPTTPGTTPGTTPTTVNTNTSGGVAKNGKVVSLTFDDGPNPVNTPKVLDILKQFGVKGTFFVTGQGAQRHPELIKRIIEEGHTVANHTWDHPDLSKLDQQQIKSQLDRTQAAVDQALGYHYEMTMIRPPYGAGTSKVKAAAPNKDVVLWNVDSNDWRYKNDDQKILQNVFDGSESVRARGGTILFHDIHPQTVRILDDVIGRLQSEGYDIQRTDEVLANKRNGVPN